jgi:DHA2 family multidrug resistance protein-like MFS transporter
MAGAFVLAAGGFLVLTQLRVGSPLLVVLVGAGLLAVGLVMTLTLVTDLVVGTVTPERAGSASALMETCSEFGGALGIAVLGSVAAAVYDSRLGAHLPPGLTSDEAHAARQGLAAAVATSVHLHGDLGDALLNTAHHAFIDGMNVVAWVGAAVLIAASAATAVLLRRAE